ncbi:MAG: tetratricopeptide repeat protein [Phycisphaerales bacterium]|nr:tetratricopeptide repeat protein [Phycisphaerales bacterium]
MITPSRRHTPLLVLVLLSALAPIAGCGGPTRSENMTRGITINEGERIKKALENLELAERAHRANHPDEAVEYYRRAIESYSDFHMAWNDLGVELMQLGRHQDAEQAFRMAANVEPTDPRPYYNLGTLYQKLWYDDEALEYYIKALRRRPTYLPALRGAIQSADLIKQVDDTTLEWIRQALLLESDPQWLSYFQRLRLDIESRLADEGL